MKSYKALLFDLDGTLLDSRRDLSGAVQYALRSLDPREPPTGDEIIEQVGKPLASITQNLGYNFSKAQITLFENTYRSYYEKHFQDHTKIFSGVIETLEKFKARGFKMAVITTKQQLQADMVVKAFGLNKYFDYVRGWMEGRQHKPDPEPVFSALRVLNFLPKQALYVGDTEQDILCGQAAKVDTCAVTYGFRSTKYLKSLNPTFIVDHFSDVLSIVSQ